ncbi:MAG: class I SAM-dependent RNA methyltransferase [Deltaproteobacteria bacterium]|nr:class I SAM-dependent RNA methyltransferase [Deltaproteobacteria bacterium]
MTTVRVEALGPSGDGLCRVDGRWMHVPGALPGEVVTLGGDGAPAVLEASPERVAPPCPRFGVCGGCAWQHASASLQASAHLALLQRALPPEVRALPVSWHPSPAPYGYRSRARLAWDARGPALLLGFRARRSQDLVPADPCPVLDERIQKAAKEIGQFVRKIGDQGELSLALGRSGRVVCSLHPQVAVTAELVEELSALLGGGLEGVALGAPGASAPITVGDPRPAQRGADGELLLLPPDGFAQANEGLNGALVALVARRAEARGRKVLELHAGSGNFTLALAREAAAVCAVESDLGAVKALEENLRARAQKGVTVLRGMAEDAVRGHPAEVVVLDPPRTGAREVCEALLKGRAKRVVYVSCDPPTLGRDLQVLLGGFRVEHLDAFEMFPQTPHLECVVTLLRKPRARW